MLRKSPKLNIKSITISIYILSPIWYRGREDFFHIPEEQPLARSKAMTELWKRHLVRPTWVLGCLYHDTRKEKATEERVIKPFFSCRSITQGNLQRIHGVNMSLEGQTTHWNVNWTINPHQSGVKLWEKESVVGWNQTHIAVDWAEYLRRGGQLVSSWENHEICSRESST